MTRHALGRADLAGYTDALPVVVWIAALMAVVDCSEMESHERVVKNLRSAGSGRVFSLSLRSFATTTGR